MKLHIIEYRSLYFIYILLCRSHAFFANKFFYCFNDICTTSELLV